MPIVLLVHCDGANGSTTFTDASPSAHTLTRVITVVSTASPKFGTGAASFTAASWIESNNAADFNLGAGQFTIEAWAYFTAAFSGIQAIVAQFGGATNLGWFFGSTQANELSLTYSTTGSNTAKIGLSLTFTPTLNTWHHLAVDRDASNTVRFYLNGAVIASTAAAVTIFPSTQLLRIGNDQNGNRGFPGMLDEIRVTIGLAQYAGAFTPPTAPFNGVAITASQARVMVLA